MAKGQIASALLLTATRRTTQGSRAARRLRAQGLVPGVLYGKATAPVPIAVPQRELTKVLHTKGGEHALVTLRVEDGPAGAPWERPVLVQAVQHHPVDVRVLHVDFHAIVLTERLRVKVRVILTGEAVGVKQEGGVLEHFLREVEVECLPTEIPQSIACDVSALAIGDTVHVRDLAPPTQATITSDPDGVIASVQAPRMEKVEEEAAPTEPEVLREKKEVAEADAGEGAKADAGETKHEPKDTKEKEGK